MKKIIDPRRLIRTLKYQLNLKILWSGYGKAVEFLAYTYLEYVSELPTLTLIETHQTNALFSYLLSLFHSSSPNLIRVSTFLLSTLVVCHQNFVFFPWIFTLDKLSMRELVFVYSNEMLQLQFVIRCWYTFFSFFEHPKNN